MLMAETQQIGPRTHLAQGLWQPAQDREQLSCSLEALLMFLFTFPPLVRLKHPIPRAKHYSTNSVLLSESHHRSMRTTVRKGHALGFCYPRMDVAKGQFGNLSIAELKALCHERGLRITEDEKLPLETTSRLVADVAVPLRRVMYIMRGPPGCGKSTAARSLLAQHLRAQGVHWNAGGRSFDPIARSFIFSNDDYFTRVDEAGLVEYTYDRTRLPDIHRCNEQRCRMAAELGVTPLIVDNTNLYLWSMRSYVEMADSFGYLVHVIGPRDLGPEALDVDSLVARCEFGEGREVGKRMSRSFIESRVREFEELPLSENALGGDPLEAIRCALRPWESR